MEMKAKKAAATAAVTSHNCHANNNGGSAIATVHRPINIFGMIYNGTHLTAHSLATTVVTLIREPQQRQQAMGCSENNHTENGTQMRKAN